MFTGNVELSYRKGPHVQLIKGEALTGHIIHKINSEASIKVSHIDNNHAMIDVMANYKRKGFYQVKWWMMLPFSENVQVNGKPVDVYMNDACSVAGLEYGELWTRVKLLKVEPGMIVKVGKFTFTVKDGDVKDLMIYRRLDNQLIELSFIWWNVDRYEDIPKKSFRSTVKMCVDGGIPVKKEIVLQKRIYNKLKRTLKKMGEKQ